MTIQSRAPRDTAEAFDEFYLACAARMVRHAYAMTGSLPEAQDLAQEAFARAWQRWPTVSGCDSPEAWVRRTLNNLAISRWRRLRVAQAAARKLSPPASVPEVGPDTVALIEGLRSLPQRQRTALVLRYLAEMPVAQIAAELGASQAAVRGWLHRGRIALAAALDDSAVAGEESRGTRVRCGVPGRPEHA